MMGGFLPTIRYGVVSRYIIEWIPYERECIAVIGPLSSRCRTLPLSIELFRVMEKYDADPIVSLLASVREIDINFDFAENPGYCPFSFEESIVYNLKLFAYPGLLSITHPAVSVRYRDE